MSQYSSSRIRVIALAGSLALAAVLTIVVARAAAGSQPVAASSRVPTESGELQRRETSGDPDSPDISFIDSQSATCVRPLAGTASCFIRWNYLYVTASSNNYIISMTVAVDGQIRAYHSGFFQNYMYIPGDMIGTGYRVTCGLPGSGGKDGFGRVYSFVIRARETGGLSAANYGSVTCPADVVRSYLPSVMRK